MPYSRGQVVVAFFPDSNRKTAKRRPVLIVQADNLGTGMAQHVTAMISSNMARAGHASRVAIRRATPEGQQAGIMHDSVIMTDNLATLRETEIHTTIGSWSKMGEVDSALRHTLGL